MSADNARPLTDDEYRERVLDAARAACMTFEIVFAAWDSKRVRKLLEAEWKLEMDWRKSDG